MEDLMEPKTFPTREEAVDEAMELLPLIGEGVDVVQTKNGVEVRPRRNPLVPWCLIREYDDGTYDSRPDMPKGMRPDDLSVYDTTRHSYSWREAGEERLRLRPVEDFLDGDVPGVSLADVIPDVEPPESDPGIPLELLVFCASRMPEHA